MYGPEELVFPFTNYREQRELSSNRTETRDKDAFFHLGFDQVHHAFTSEMKAVQFCRIDRRGKNWHADQGGLYDAIFYPMAKALASRKREMRESTRRSDWRYFWFFAPIVVTSGDIFFVDSTAATPVPEERNYITFKREIQSGNVKGTFSIDFIRQDQLEQFYSDCLQPLIAKVVDLTMHKADYVLNQDIPWNE